MTDFVGKRIGYIRVSSVDQNTARQLDGVPLDKVFTDKASGKDVNRPQLQACLEFVREGDTLIIHSMDRLARNVMDLLRTVEELNKRGVVVEFVKEHLSFTGNDSPMSQLMLTIMGAVAQFERALIRERQREGQALAKKAGVYKGRKPSLSPERAEEARKLVATGVAKAKVARKFGVSRVTLYSYLKPSLEPSHPSGLGAAKPASP
jgi:DNA invertase Pin-like site-specific DNA recombinase